MRRLDLLLIDLFLVALATVLALLLRDNFEFSAPRLTALLPYLLISLGVAAIIFPAFGINRSIWRFTSVADYLRILAATVASVAGAVLLGFGLNRLDGVPRVLPILQGLLIVSALVGARVSERLRHAARERPAPPAGPLPAAATETLLVVGLGRVTELYLRAVVEFAPNRMKVAGLLGSGDHQTGRSVQGYAVLGTAQDAARVLRDLEVHGVLVDRIIVTTDFGKMTPEARHALIDVEKRTDIRLEFLADRLGLDARPGAASGGNASGEDLTFSIVDLEALAGRPYWKVKRAIDMVAAFALLVILAPLMVFVALLVAMDTGPSVIFWQLRPGLGNRAFHMYKFRTMAAAHDLDGREVPETERLSAIGRFLRRARLDELPQLYNILVGEMSFVGPRPLLASEQSAAYAARLLVRPGLTGWAQIKGGRAISISDKAALDVWYLHHASLVLDLEILLRTIPFAFREDRVNTAAISQAWRDLRRAGICREATRDTTRAS